MRSIVNEFRENLISLENTYLQTSLHANKQDFVYVESYGARFLWGRYILTYIRANTYDSTHSTPIQGIQ